MADNEYQSDDEQMVVHKSSSDLDVLKLHPSSHELWVMQQNSTETMKNVDENTKSFEELCGSNVPPEKIMESYQEISSKPEMLARYYTFCDQRGLEENWYGLVNYIRHLQCNTKDFEKIFDAFCRVGYKYSNALDILLKMGIWVINENTAQYFAEKIAHPSNDEISKFLNYLEEIAQYSEQFKFTSSMVHAMMIYSNRHEFNGPFVFFIEQILKKDYSILADIPRNFIEVFFSRRSKSSTVRVGLSKPNPKTQYK